MSSSTKCSLCLESYSVLRRSTKCDFCTRVYCSTCCHPSPLDKSHNICLTCIQQQRKKDDPNDDRPKWLREAQKLRRAQKSFTCNFSHQTPIPYQPKVTADKKLLDDRPKWLREAQELRKAQQGSSHKSSFGTSDLELRLANLKNDALSVSEKPVASEEDLHLRLSKLKGSSNVAPRADDPSIVLPPKILSETEQIESLITQIKERVNLGEEQVDLIKQLEVRLKKLKEETAKLGIQPSDLKVNGSKEPIEVGLDSDEEAERIVKMLPNLDEAEELEEAEDFCVICPEDPQVICQDCDGDKYCMRCFNECHREWAAVDHRTKIIQHRQSK